MKLTPDYKKLLRKASAPGVGPYYWIPSPNGSWKLSAYVTGREDFSPDHGQYWKSSLAEKLALAWDKSDLLPRIRELAYGLPRGRVSFFEKIYYINHGGDAPVDHWIEPVKDKYNLSGWALARPKQLIIARDPHERMLDKHQSQLRDLLGLSDPEFFQSKSASRPI